jgi:hypothetical protein
MDEAGLGSHPVVGKKFVNQCREEKASYSKTTTITTTTTSGCILLSFPSPHFPV